MRVVSVSGRLLPRAPSPGSARVARPRPQISLRRGNALSFVVSERGATGSSLASRAAADCDYVRPRTGTYRAPLSTLDARALIRIWSSARVGRFGPVSRFTRASYLVKFAGALHARLRRLEPRRERRLGPADGLWEQRRAPGPIRVRGFWFELRAVESGAKWSDIC